jgi:formylmethanofuran dehydrogenase subunit E
MKFGQYSLDEYVHLVRSFHGSVAPGLLLGGAMVEIANNHFPEGELYDALCETSYCLPDAVQLLTPCTVGNGWLKIVNLGRFALTLYEKYSGRGVRVFLDARKLDGRPEIKNWYMKLKAKREQDSQLLCEQITDAGVELFSIQNVKVKGQFLAKRSKGQIALCPLCGEAYPRAHGAICRGCQGESPYGDSESHEELSAPGFLKKVAVEEATGWRALHDMTMIIPEISKGPAFRSGDLIAVGDICRLQQMGRQSIYVEQDLPAEMPWVHENRAAQAFARAMAGEGILGEDAPSEGKVNLHAARDGLFIVDHERMQTFNLVPGVMCASRHGFSLVKTGRKVAGTRAIPLYLPRSEFEKAMAILAAGPLFRVVPLRQARVGILVTGTEIFRGLVEDRFIPILQNKIEELGSEMIHGLIVPDERAAITEGVKELLGRGADLLITTAGLSVDPDDVTRQGLTDAGATDLLYGAPVLPGAMTLLARIGSVQVLGVPACALYFKTTALDLMLPRLLAGVKISRRDLATMGHGGMCLECKVCTYPKCPFGRG